MYLYSCTEYSLGHWTWLGLRAASSEIRRCWPHCPLLLAPFSLLLVFCLCVRVELLPPQQ
ncbi:hypothetical protein PHLGIDRAFT_181569 [Phlebiopsis gigantea 11061_1 CR5-6]|uniref:Uncharacterized protein n=1 Tax=Phlebiopsis gigantea (strain 11061_1 CR5-6) TaxID=745531 RepID=A0A0C3S431_PHLG1|nr:hypothetical protein PHLGIDRAFT_181569 [Phlebiopsis gigantea 11061_1 CR5-6]